MNLAGHFLKILADGFFYTLDAVASEDSAAAFFINHI
jgi:hypothetical protein